MILLQDASENLRVPEVTLPPAIAISPNRQFTKSIGPAEIYYGAEVPATRDVAYDNSPGLLETSSVLEPRVPEFYSPQIPMPTSTQIVPPIDTDARSSEAILQPPSNIICTTTRPLSDASDGSQTNVNRRSGHFGQTMHHSPQKPEISHPVSRLCDTIESNDKTDPFVGAEVEKTENEPRADDKLVERVIISSDNNNNNAIISQESVQSDGLQESHRCDQCGKTFVTRASLKVHRQIYPCSLITITITTIL